MCYICKVLSHCHHSPLKRAVWERWFHWLSEKWNSRFMFSHDQLVNSCHWSHMLGLSQHLFAEQHFDLVMTSGNVSFQHRRSSELGGSWQGGGGETVRGKEKKKRKAQDEEQWKGRCSKVPVVSQLGVHALITDVAWGEWRTNSGSWARWGVAHNEV